MTPIEKSFAVCWPRWVFVGEQYSWWLARNTFGSFNWLKPSSIGEWFVGLWDWISARLRSHHNKTWTLTITIRLCQSRHDKSTVASWIKWVYKQHAHAHFPLLCQSYHWTSFCETIRHFNAHSHECVIILSIASQMSYVPFLVQILFRSHI